MQCNCTIFTPEKPVSSLLVSASAFYSVLGRSTKLIIPPAASAPPPLQFSCCLGPSSRVTAWHSSTVSTFQVPYCQPGFFWICKPSGALEGDSQKFRTKPKGGGQEDGTNSLPCIFTAEPSRPQFTQLKHKRWE